MSDRRIGIGLLGYGNIGRELVRYLARERGYARIVRIGRRRPPADAPPAVRRLVAARAEEVLDDPAVQIIVELTGDPQHGARYLLEAIDRGKHVVTANKSALAIHWREIMERARRRGVAVGFEATVGGGMPVVRTMQRHLAADETEAFAGILNGTCNFILARMKEYVIRHMDDPAIQRRSLPLEAALAQAQRRGYAEPDPTLDLNGADTKYKVSILADLAFRVAFDPEQIFCQGIWQEDQRILPSDFYFLHHRRYLDSRYELKLLGIAQQIAGRPVLRVHPTLVEKEGPYADLAGVHENFNGLLVRGRRLNAQFLKGLGAGPKPTVVSVASDVREIATSILQDGSGPPVPPVEGAARPGSLDRLLTRGYIRSVSPDVKGVYAKKLEILARHKVNVQSVVNVKEFVYGRDRFTPDYIEIDAAPDGAVRAALAEIARLRGVRDAMYFRLLEL